ncbi:ABC transporter substrate-binding protein [Okeania sp. KiyG1]|uniref:ABC transporter substrate-binding protein n=1 Tax=Okeania sp. KiyG1 TaxID=2720165 RepID=UPI00199B5F6D|nr:ABC transporter substrate-binding protein [Okeania sp. KiyG1]GGA17009.1 hypothetical protein CYANOKiyG1_31230 [Okeania sp. KiyG1]
MENIYTELGLEKRAMEIPEKQITHVSSIEGCQNATLTLEGNAKNWLREPQFGDIRGRIIGRLKDGTSNKPVRVIIDTSNSYLRKLSWDCWDLFQKKRFLPQAEFTLLSQYSQFNRPTETLQKPVQILAIFGSDQGSLELKQDRKLIDNLERHGASIKAIPATENSLTYEELFNTLWQGNWDIIFYSGHSAAETIQIGNTLEIPIHALGEALKEAAPRVKLAIFNSCDGLGIAEYLADLDIPHLIVMRELVPDLVAQRFLEYFLDEFTQRKPLHAAVRKARRRLQHLEFHLPNKSFYPRASKLPVLIQNPTTPELYWPEPEPEPEPERLTRPPIAPKQIIQIILFLLIIAGFLGISKLIPKPETLEDQISQGEEILVKLFSPRDKQRGVEAVAICQKPWNHFLPIWKSNIRQDWSDCFESKKSYREAARYLQESWDRERRDPETLIYLNNAILEATGADFYTIAVVVPVLEDETGKNAELAEEILRGVAQMQTEVNLSLKEKFFNLTLPGADFLESKSLNGKGLKVIIANDANNEEQAKKVANTIVKQSEILGVIGHWTSEMTTATVDIYDQNELVIVSPGTTTSELTDDPRRFFFRVTTNNYLPTDAAVDVLMSNLVNQKRVAIFYNPASPYSSDYKKRFEEKFLEKVGTEEDIIDSFDISQRNFDAQSAIQKIRNSGELAIVLIPDGQVSNALDNALEIIKENDGQNWMIGNWSVYSPKTLNIGQSQLLEKLILTVPWHPLRNLTSYFSQTSKRLWGGSVSPRTVLSYDAAQVLIEGIRQKPDRLGIQKRLADESFNFEGVTGKIEFQRGTGDRQKLPFELVKVVPCPTNNEYGFKFIPLELTPEAAEVVESECSVPD